MTPVEQLLGDLIGLLGDRQIPYAVKEALCSLGRICISC